MNTEAVEALRTLLTNKPHIKWSEGSGLYSALRFDWEDDFNGWVFEVEFETDGSIFAYRYPSEWSEELEEGVLEILPEATDPCGQLIYWLGDRL